MTDKCRCIHTGLILLAAAASAGLGGCPRAEDALEPNNTAESATRLMPGVAVEGRVVQRNPDVFVVTAGPNQSLVLNFESIGDEEDCEAFTVLGPDGRTLYADTNTGCGRLGPVPIVQAGGRLELLGAGAYRLTIRADVAGDYVLTIVENGAADNIFTFSWRYRLTASLE